MKRESQRGGGPAGEARRALGAPPRFEEPHGQKADQSGIGAMDEDIGQVIAPRIHAPQDMVEGEGEPRHRYPVALVEAREHPAELGWTKPAPGAIDDEIRFIVPWQKAAAEGDRK